MATLLVVEDEPHIASGLRFNLEAEGHDISVVETGSAALDAIAVRPDAIDCMILDVMLPGMDGFAVAAAARARGWYRPILMLTARGRAEDVLRGFEAGADDYLPKPFDLQELLARVTVWLRVRQHAREAQAIQQALREAERREGQAQVEAIHLAAREVAERLNNHLTMAVGFLELLQHSSHALTAAEQTLLADARRGLAGAVGTVEQLQQVVRIATKDTPSGLALDLERSTRSGAGSS
jgi:DNA-binding response OmpR family regulator